jgi:hypothetical protein
MDRNGELPHRMTAAEAEAIQECLQTAIAGIWRMASITQLLRKLDTERTGELDDYRAYCMLLEEAEKTVNVLLAAVEEKLTRLLDVEVAPSEEERELPFPSRAARRAAM